MDNSSFEDDSGAVVGPDPSPGHVPVLCAEVLESLQPTSGGRYVDATVGGGGHATELLEISAPAGRVLGMDRDPAAVARAAARLEPYGSRARVVHASYTALLDKVRQAGFWPVDGVLFDLGYSSWQIDDPARGFAFRLDGPLDMRFDPTGEALTAADIVNRWDEAELVRVLWEYGEERHSRRIAAAMVRARPIKTTARLADVVAQAVGGHRGRLHPATRTFQALRIAVNRELEGLRAALPQAIEALRPGGRLAVITFHSLEDRIVKQYFKRAASDCICPPESPICTCDHRPTVRRVNRKPLRPSAREIESNSRSRSAKLRVAEKLPQSDPGI